MFLGMPGLNGDSYPASQVRRPHLLFSLSLLQVVGWVYVGLHTCHRHGGSPVRSVLLSLGGFRGSGSGHQALHDKHLYG